ncbi:MAG: sulfite exporter TauE/SafE family protein [Gammaproteobacteria bacterium]|nr:sulfite exporter TauE/SafE family protein [Gammaproteobacteria bacterium]
MIEILLYLATGIFAGLASGLLGVGGGLIIVPVLFFIFSAQNLPAEHIMHMALATSLATIIVTSISSTRAHHKKHAVLWPVFLLLAPGICLGAWLGGIAASAMPTNLLKPAFGIFELFVAIHMLWNRQSRQHNTSINKIKSAAGGFVIGAISALVGIGGGTLTVPFLHWHSIAIRNAIATSAACGLPIAIFGTASYIYTGWSIDDLPQQTLGYVHLQAFALIIATSFIFAPVGARLAHQLPEAALKKGFALFLILIGLKLTVL